MPDIPANEYYEYYGPDFKLNICPSNMENLNTADYLEKIKVQLFECLRHLPHAPSVQFHQTPADRGAEAAAPEGDPDVRVSQHDLDKHVFDRREFYEDDRDQDRTRMSLLPTSVSAGAAAAAAAAAPMDMS